MLIAVGQLAVGLVVLGVGADVLVRGASRLAATFGVSPMVVGLTVVAVGTSAPELAVTLTAALAGNTDIALGNVVGSNICNIGLVLGLSAVITPMLIERSVRPFLPVMLGAGLLVPVLALDGVLGWIDGAIMLAGATGYYGWMIVRRKGDAADDIPEAVPGFFGATPGHLIMIAAGIVALVLGSKAIVAGAVTLAAALGVPERIIGLTLVAFSTSLPELATTVAAAVRKRADIGVGNVVGSNIANVLLILGATAAVEPVAAPLTRPLVIDLTVMTAFSLAMIAFTLWVGRVGRVSGGALLAGYGAYTAYLYF